MRLSRLPVMLNLLVTENKKIIFTNGCFDVLHIGHVRLLNYCATLGQVVVGLNSDTSVRAIKGPGRPINNQLIRKEFLENLRVVDQVLIFEELTPELLINKVKPNVIVKGGDYEISQVVGSDVYEVRIFPRIENFSSSLIINKIQE